MLCNEIASLRRKLRRVPKRNIIFVDESQLRLNDCPSSTLVAPGENACAVVYNDTSYATRYDIIGFVNSEQVFSPMIYGPEERKQWGSKGITSNMFNTFIEDYLARSIAALDQYPLVLCCDKSNAHNAEKIKESFENGLCFEISEIIYLPTASAKRISPLDNELWADWKRRCRLHNLSPSNIKQVMSDEWEQTATNKLQHYYKRCIGTARSSPYFDCPLPSQHQH